MSIDYEKWHIDGRRKELIGWILSHRDNDEALAAEYIDSFVLDVANEAMAEQKERDAKIVELRISVATGLDLIGKAVEGGRNSLLNQIAAAIRKGEA